MNINAFFVKETGAAILIANDSVQKDVTATQWIPRSVIPFLKKTPSYGVDHCPIMLKVDGWWLEKNEQANKNLSENFSCS